MDKHKVSLVKCAGYDATQVQAAVKSAVDLLGGIEKFIKPGEKVLLKPNLLTDSEPDKGITTHPEVVRAVIRLIKPVTKDIICGDGPSVWGEKKDAERVYNATGMTKVCQEEGVELVYFTHPVIKKGLPLADWAFKVDKFVNIPKFKTHSYTVLTAALKNLFGLIVGMHKMKIHFDNPRPWMLSKVIVDIYEMRQPDLNILDGVVAMEGQGPGSGGTLKKMGLVAASVDGACLDMVLAGLMKVSGLDIPTNKEAFRRGLGPRDLASVDILGGTLDDFMPRDFKLPKSGLLSKLPPMPAVARDILTSFLSTRPVPVASRCKLCGLCQKSCPAGAITQTKLGIKIDRAKCILCLCCQEVCPCGAIDIEKGLLLRLLSRKGRKDKNGTKDIRQSH